MKQKYIEIIKDLSLEERNEFIHELLQSVESEKYEKHFNENAHNISNCPHCHSNHIVRIGKVNGVQRFKCKECGKCFSITTKTIFFSSNKPLTDWVKYIDLMSKKLSLREIAKEMKINLKTAFYWRHKILNALKSNEKMSGIVEADETYFRESQKGSKKLTRKPHKSGISKLNKTQKYEAFNYTDEEYNAQKHKRGLSKELICVLTATDRTNNVFGRPVGYGKVQPDWVRNNLQSVIASDSTLITDGEKSYNTIQNVNHKTFKFGISKSKTHNLGRIDNIHTTLKLLINGAFKGVATKYLEGYVNYIKILKNKDNIFDRLMNVSTYISNKEINNLTVCF